MNGGDNEFEDKIDNLMKIDEEVDIEFGTITEDEDIVYPNKVPEILNIDIDKFMGTNIDHYVNLCEDRSNYMKIVSGFTYLCSISEGRFKDKAAKLKEELKNWYKESK